MAVRNLAGARALALFLVAAGAFAASASTAAASAVVLTDAQYSWSFTHNTVPPFGGGSQSGDTAGQYSFITIGTFFAGTLTIVGQPEPLVKAFAFVNSVDDAPIQSDIQGSIAYEGMVSGPSAGPVTLDITDILKARGSGAGNTASASWSVSQSGVQLAGDQISARASRVVEDIPEIQVETDVPFQVSIAADAHAYSTATTRNCCKFGSSMAYADPLFAIDPSTVNAQDYSLSFSAGIGNSPAGRGVPEPGTWALTLIGFGALGASLRASRARAALPA